MTRPEDDDTERLLADSGQTFLVREQGAERLRALQSGQRVGDRAFWQRLAAQGWLALLLPESLGGSGLATRHAGVLARAFGRHVVPEPFIACSAMPAMLRAQLSTIDGAAGWQTLEAGLLGGAHVSTLAWQESAQSLDPAMGGTVVRRDAESRLRLDGLKHAVVCPSFADSLLVTATFDGAPSLWCVPVRAAGVVMHEQPTSDGGTLAAIRFDAVGLDADAALARGHAVTGALQRTIDGALLLCAAQLDGMATQALALTLEHLRTRVQFDQHIGSFQSLQHMAVDLRVQTALAAASYRSALRQHHDAPGTPATQAAISAAKARAGDTALLAGRFGVQAHGAIGFAAEAAIGLYLKAAIRLAAWLGNGSLHRQRFGVHSGLVEPIA